MLSQCIFAFAFCLLSHNVMFVVLRTLCQARIFVTNRPVFVGLFLSKLQNFAIHVFVYDSNFHDFVKSET